MVKKTNWRKALCLTMLMVYMALGLTACKKKLSDEEILANMKEFTAKSESFSIYLDKEWEQEDLGLPNWLGVYSADQKEAVIIMQVPKEQYKGTFDSLESVQVLVEDNFQISEKKTVEAPAVVGVSDLTAYVCDMTTDTAKGKGYVISGESDYAYYMLCYVGNTISNEKKRIFDVSCSTLKETPKEEENNFETEITNSIRWFNATYGIITRLNQQDVNYFGGYAANDTNQKLVKQMLAESWEVTNRASADEAMEWIVTQGHRTTYKQDMKSLVDAGIKNVKAEERKAFVEENFVATGEEADKMVALYANYEQYGENAIDAWDYCRGISLAAYYYHAGYYTEQEALDKSMEIAQMMQPLYASWDEAMNSYLLGYEYWAEEPADKRRAVYEELKAEEDSVYKVDWNLTFEKTW